jgi:hypothetical protein
VKKLKNLTDLFEQAENIIKKIKKDDKICLIHHDDSDGCSSAALFTILIHDLIDDYPILFPVTGVENINSQLFSKIKSFNPDFVFIVLPLELMKMCASPGQIGLRITLADRRFGSTPTEAQKKGGIALDDFIERHLVFKVECRRHCDEPAKFSARANPICPRPLP